MPASMDLIGKKFGHWTVLEKMEERRGKNVMWKCRCVCEKIGLISTGMLRSENSRSCGCKGAAPARIKIGDKFGFLTVVSESPEKNHGHKRWNCKCDCGNDSTVNGINLTNLLVESCGCKRLKNRENHPNWTGYKDIHGSFWKTIIRGADQRGLAFEITIEEAWELYLRQGGRCALTGQLIFFQKRTTHRDAKLATASLDRIDSSKGYTLDNIQWIERGINRIKMDWSQEEFIKMCENVTNYQRYIRKLNDA